MPDAPAELDELLAVLVDGGVEFLIALIEVKSSKARKIA
jgi:hypothetical protein